MIRWHDSNDPYYVVTFIGWFNPTKLSSHLCKRGCKDEIFKTFSYYNRTSFPSLFSQTVIVKQQVGGRLKILSHYLISFNSLLKRHFQRVDSHCTIVLSFSGRRDNDISWMYWPKGFKIKVGNEWRFPLNWTWLWEESHAWNSTCEKQTRG